MNIGKHIIARALADRTVRPFTDAGLTESWMAAEESAAVFDGTTARAWKFLLGHSGKHGRTPPEELFRREYPPAGFRLPDEPLLATELTELAVTAARRAVIEMAQVAVQEILTSPDFPDGGLMPVTLAAGVLREAFGKLEHGIRESGTILNLTEGLDEASRAAYFGAPLEFGIPVGIPGIDEDFHGIQPGQLVTLIGRQKSSKTFLAVNSAVQAWLDGWDVLFITYEMGATEIRDRAYAVGAHVNPERIRRRDLDAAARRKIEDFMTQLENDEGAGQNFRIREGTVSCSPEDLLADISRYQPHVVYVDGAYFLTDRHTGKSAGSDWVANENVARDLKLLARNPGTAPVALLVTTQAQEKQHNHRQRGIEGRSIMAGTGLLRTSDLVLGADMDQATRILTVNCVMSRHAHVGTGRYQWDWDAMILRGARDEDLEAGIREMGI